MDVVVPFGSNNTFITFISGTNSLSVITMHLYFNSSYTVCNYIKSLFLCSYVHSTLN